jgi:hypothetical protein
MVAAGRFLPNASMIFKEFFRLLPAQKQPHDLKNRKSGCEGPVTSGKQTLSYAGAGLPLSMTAACRSDLAVPARSGR